MSSSNPTDPRSQRRVEDLRFLTGQGRYVGDAAVEEHLHAAVVRSPHASARILSVDTSAAAQLPGVQGVFTADDLQADGLGPLPCSQVLPDEAGLVVPPRFALAQERVRHVGEPVAFVVAGTERQAREAAEAVVVEYALLAAVTDCEAALAQGSPQLWDQAPGNLAFRYRKGDAAAVAAALDASALVVELTVVNNRIAAAALEPRIAVGAWDAAAGTFRLDLSGASVHMIRRELATGVFGIAEDRLVVACPDVGGGFGMKNVSYPEYVLVLWAARRLGRPVRWTGDRTEEFLAGVHARANVTRGRLGVDAKGRFTALAVETIADLGSALSSLGPGASTTAPTPAMGGLYEIPLVSMDVRGAFTNTVPVDAYRGAGKPEANYLIERLVDAAAARLGLAPAALRRRTLIRRTPHANALGYRIDSGDPRGNLARALAAADQPGFAARRRHSRRRGWLRGFGVACFLETARGQPGEEAWLRLRPDGSLELAVGTQSNGQGHETSFVHLVADRLGLPEHCIAYRQADTALIPRGGGHGGARSLHMAGPAMLTAADDLVAKARPLAARALQAGAETLAYANGVFTGPSGGIALSALPAALGLTRADDLPTGHGDNRCDLYTFPNGCHVAEVEVDPETGVVRLDRYLAVDDYGTLLNPLLTEGQIHGGLAQGIGQALLEGIVYDEDGQLVTATFMDYAVPRACDLPPFDVRFVEIPTAANPLGAKGSGQAGAIGAPQTVIAAVLDALRPLGVEHLDMPATPERVWAAIQETRRPGSSS